MSPRIPLTLTLALAALACRDAEPPPAAPVPVAVAPVERRDVPVVLAATGTVEPLRTASVQAQVTGLVTRVAFREGQEVREGDLLFEIDPRPFRAALTGAEGALARDRAQWEVADRDARRLAELAEKGYATQQEFDQARARVAALAAALQADSGAVQRARLDLQFASVRAPIAGRTGGLLVREGNLVRANEGTPLVVINQVAPVLVRFTLPADQLAAVRARGGAALPVFAQPVGDTATATGRVVFLDNAVDSLSGTIALKARFENADARLWPGALVRVRLELDVERDALVVPAPAVVEGQQGAVVFVAEPDGTARVQPVRVRRRAGDVAVLEEGLAPGTEVVTNGQVRLAEGTRIAPRRAESAGARQAAP
jgi:multidrug efflux system membrane fusion protein